MQTLMKVAKIKSFTVIGGSICVTKGRAFACDIDNNLFVEFANDYIRSLDEGIYSHIDFHKKPQKIPGLTIPDFPVDSYIEPLEASEAPCWLHDRELFLSDLEYVSKAMSNDETRYFLNGIHIDGTTLVATDGHRMHTATHSRAYTLDFKDRHCIMHKSFVKYAIAAMKEFKKETVVYFAATPDAAALKIRSDTDYLRISAKNIDGRFPVYKKVIPDIKDYVVKCELQPDCFDMVSQRLKLLRSMRRDRNMMKYIKSDLRLPVMRFDPKGTAALLDDTLQDAKNYFFGDTIKETLLSYDFNLAYLMDAVPGTLLVCPNNNNRDAAVVMADNRIAVLMPMLR